MIRFKFWGFSVVEVIIVLAVSLLLLAWAGNKYADFFNNSLVENNHSEVLSLFHLAQSKAMSGEDDNRFKVVLSANSASLQKEGGEVVETKYVDSRVILTFTNSEILFEKNTGTTTSCPTLCTVRVRLINGPIVQKLIEITNQGVIDAK